MNLKKICEESWAAGQSVDVSGAHRNPKENIGPTDYYSFLAGFVRQNEIRTIIEIGTHYGGSALAMLAGGAERIVTVDISTLSDPQLQGQTKIVKVLGSATTVTTAADVHCQLMGRPCDLLFVDTAHRYSPTMEAFNLFFQRFRPTWTIFDDITLNDEMKQVWREIKRGFPYAINVARVVPEVRRGTVGFGLVKTKTRLDLIHRADQFRPRGSRKPVYFHHIPKTGGESVNAMFVEAYGEDNSCPHAEQLSVRRRVGEDVPHQVVDFVSSHNALPNWEKVDSERQYARITLLRDPWVRLVSHINWFDRFNLGIQPERLRTLRDDQKELVGALRETEFNSKSSMEAFFANATPYTTFMLNNLMTRMLTIARLPEKGHAAVGEDHYRRAVSALETFAVVGTLEHFGEFISACRDAFDVDFPSQPTHTNRTAWEARLSPGNEAAKSIFAPWTNIDYRLYAAATSEASS